ncbi:MAG: acetylglutamate kinase [Proteobacteria bacterium]|nr:acetylglutamate kinase [Pseudomonadota bacterium]
MSAHTKARVLAEALPYIRAFHGKTLVIRFGGHAMADPALREGFARDVALLQLVGMRPVVVHGGGWRVDELTARMGIPTERRNGVRVTDERTLTVIEMALSELNQELVGLINRHRAKAIGLDGQDGAFIRARPLAGADAGAMGFVGEVDAIDPSLITLMLSRQFIPVVMPIGVGRDGTAYHINSDHLAGQIARALTAEKLVLMTNIDGVHGRDGKLAYVLTASDAQALLRDDVVQGGMRPRLTAALDAVREGVRSVHIIDGGVPSALLLEVLTAEGVGTAVRSDDGPHFFEDSRAYLMG